jgi:uncharacterized protein (TIRG00374 family)
MSVTPGKAGEAIKSVLLRESLKVPYNRSVPVVIFERITDVIALVFLVSMGFFRHYFGFYIFIIALTLLSGVLAIFSIRNIMTSIINRAGKFFRKPGMTEGLLQSYENMAQLLSLANFLIAIGLGLLAWFWECLGFYYVIKALGSYVTIYDSTFIYSFSTLMGAVCMIPGGLGITEGSMSALLAMSGITECVSVGATVITRFCTLWFAVLIGFVAILLGGFAKLINSNSLENQDAGGN